MLKKRPTLKDQEEQRREHEEQRREHEELQGCDLCITFDDIMDDAGKTTTRHIPPEGGLFNLSLFHLTGMRVRCEHSLANDIKSFISLQLQNVRSIPRKKNPQKLVNIPFGRDRTGRLILPAMVSSNAREALIDFNRNNVVIPQETLATTLQLRRQTNPALTEEVLKNDLENDIENRTCEGFRSFVRDNSGIPGLPESFNISSLYDEGARSINCRHHTLAGWLTDKYGGHSWSLDLFNAGLTNVRNSSLSAVWSESDTILHPFPAGATSVSGHVRGTILTNNQVLFTLKLGNNSVGCTFTFPPREGGGNVYSNAGEGATKTPVFYHFGEVRFDNCGDFISRCFRGNVPKNEWFNRFSNLTDDMYLIFGPLIQLGKAVGDASFATTCTMSEIFSSNDIAATARALLHNKAVAYRSYDLVQNRENIYTVIVPVRPQSKLKKIAKKANPKPRKEKRIYKVQFIKVLAEKIIQRKSGRKKKTPAWFTYTSGGTLTNTATADTVPNTVPDTVTVPTLLDAIIAPDAPVTLPTPEPEPEDNGDSDDDDDGHDDHDDDEVEDNDDDSLVDYLSILLKSKIEEFKAFSEYLKLVNEQLKGVNFTSTYTLDGVPIKVNLKTFNVEKKILTIESVVKFIEKFIETPIDSLVEIIITSYIVKNGEIPSDVELVNMFSGLIQYNLFVINENTNFLSSLPSYYFIYGFYNLYSSLMKGSYKDENEVTKKFSDVNIFDQLETAANENTDDNLNRYFADTDSKFTELSLPNTEISNSIESIGKIVGNLTLLLQNFFENPKSDHETTISVINILRTKLESREIKKQQFYQELSFNLYILSSAINMNTLSFMIVHSVMIEYSRNRDYNDTELSQCITNQLITITSPQGTSIFDLEIVITFVVSMSYSDERWSISYPKGFEGLYTLITIKKFIDGESLEFLNDNRLSLQEIGDLVDRLAFEAENQNLSDADIDTEVEIIINGLSRVPKVMKTGIDTERLHALSLNEINETNQLTRSQTAGVGGKNNRISNPKHNTKYRKNYKKFVSKYIINKNKNNKKNNKNNKNNNKKNNKNKTKKNKRLTKSKPNSKRNNKTLKNKKGKSKSKSKSNNHKSNYNKKTKTNYYNYYRHNKTLKH
jgi:hypothetical protein